VIILPLQSLARPKVPETAREKLTATRAALARSPAERFCDQESRSYCPSGQWSEGDYDMLATGVVIGRIFWHPPSARPDC
jgi:hypothetical protein